jgi:jumonji domain-containing protein 7
MTAPATLDAISELITNYNELNSCVIEELADEPSPLKYMQYVARNTPFVVRSGAAAWKAVREWNATSLEDILGNETVNVAVTPNGFGSSPLFHEPR